MFIANEIVTFDGIQFFEILSLYLRVETGNILLGTSSYWSLSVDCINQGMLQELLVTSLAHMHAA